MIIGIISAMSVEIDALIEKMTDVKIDEISGIKYYNGNINKSRVTAAVCGIGKVNAALCTQALIMKYKPEYIINMGVAGSVSAKLNIADIVIADYVVQHDIDTTPFGDPYGLIPKINIVQVPCSEKLNKLILAGADDSDNIKTGVIATGDRFINGQKDIDFIVENFKAVAVDMESGSIGHVCYINNIDYAAVRSISDNSDDDSHTTYDKNVKKSAQTAIDLILKIL
jgi:adenosylhomocysteine nucleosidase